MEFMRPGTEANITWDLWLFLVDPIEVEFPPGHPKILHHLEVLAALLGCPIRIGRRLIARLPVVYHGPRLL